MMRNPPKIVSQSHIGRLCMKGNIYTAERCPLCKGKLHHDENRSGFTCSAHFDRTIIPQKCRVKFGRDVIQRFNNYYEAQQFLAGLRFKTVEGTFDSRDYKNSNPLGFETQVVKWLSIKEQNIKPETFSRMKNSVHKMVHYWGQKNIKTFSFGDFEDYLYSLKVGNKTRANIRSYINDFFTWLHNRENIPLPKIPEIKYELGWRNIIDIELQQKIIDEIRRICPHFKVWLGVKWLATYVAIRPKELRFLKEREIDVNGSIIIPHPKEKDPKLVAMLDDDIQIYRSLPVGMPDLYFFRHDCANGSAKPGDRYSKNMFYGWWRRACSNLGVEGVDLYGGTRHSTTSALGKYFSTEELREHGTMHKTNKAFDRYCQGKQTESLKVYQKVREMQAKKGKILKIDSKS